MVAQIEFGKSTQKVIDESGTVIATGERESEKSSLVNHIASDFVHPFIKNVNVLLVNRMDEMSLSAFLIEILQDSKLVERGIIIIDDIEQILIVPRLAIQL